MASSRPPSVLAQRRVSPQRDPNSLVASAALMTGPNRSAAKMETADWQTLAWTFYDEVGELRFGVNWLANALSRVNLIAAVPPKNQGDEPMPVDVEAEPRMAAAVAVVNQIAGGVTGQGQLLAACARQLTVPGVGYILATADDLTDSFSSWRVLSNEEAQRGYGGDETIQARDPETGEWYDLKPNDLLIKVWRAHPRRAAEPDSPVRAVLGSLAEIRLITQRIAADARSRLTGNGLLIIPTEAEFPPGQAGTTTNGEVADSFVETIVQVNSIAIRDQASPAATTPLVIRIPGEFVDKVRYLTFYSSFDTNLDPLRQAAVKRLALGLDMPPEILLGLGDSNHWSAWQIAEEAITLHVEPLAETICHALTMKFLRANLPDGIGADDVIVWYDTSDLVTRPDVSGPALEAWKARRISTAALLGYLGLDESDAPDDDEFRRRIIEDLIFANPALAPGLLAEIGIQIADAVAPSSPSAAPASAPEQPETPPGERTPPETKNEQPDNEQPDELAASALLAAADGIVYRALEKAGAKLRSAAGKNVPGGASAIECDDPALLHLHLSATEHASLDRLLDGAWVRVPEIAQRHRVDPASLRACLDTYTRGLIAAQKKHTPERLAAALG